MLPIVLLMVLVLACGFPAADTGDGGQTVAVASPATSGSPDAAGASFDAQGAPAPDVTATPDSTPTPVNTPTLIAPPGSTAASATVTGMTSSASTPSTATPTGAVPVGTTPSGMAPGGASTPPPGTPPAASASPSASASATSTSGTSSPSPTPAPERVQVAAGPQGANMRREPGTGAALLAPLRDGAELAVVGADRTVDGQAWRNVRADDGSEGWVVGAAVETVATAVPTPGGPTTAVPTSAAPLATQPTSSTSTPATVATPSPPAATAAIASLIPERALIAAGSQGANLRAEPGAGERLVKPLREGTEVTIVGADRTVAGQLWRNVGDPIGDEGWVIAEAVALLAPTATPSPARAPEPGGTPAGEATPPSEGAPSASTQAAEPTATPADPSTPCRAGQIKGDAESGLYFPPEHPEYGAIRDRVRCFDAESRATASGFLPAP